LATVLRLLWPLKMPKLANFSLVLGIFYDTFGILWDTVGIPLG
jgi:hypothetical protein